MSDETTKATIGAVTLATRMKELVEALFSLPPEMREHAVDALGELIARKSHAEEHAAANAVRLELLSMLTPVFLDYAKNLIRPHPSEPDLPPPPEVIDPGVTPADVVSVDKTMYDRLVQNARTYFAGLSPEEIDAFTPEFRAGLIALGVVD